MAALDIRPISDNGTRRMYAADSPIDFETWLDLAEDMDTELVRGVMIDKMAAQYPHEWVFGWLHSIILSYVMERSLGVVLGSRSAVKINAVDGRLPDLLFVRADNTQIIQNRAIYGTPDLVIEITSENDRPSDLIPLEADYRDIGVPEIVFIDPKQQRVRYIVKTETGYNEKFLTTGELSFVCVPGFHIQVEWLFQEDKPNAYRITKALIEAAENNT